MLTLYAGCADTIAGVFVVLVVVDVAIVEIAIVGGGDCDGTCCGWG